MTRYRLRPLVSDWDGEDLWVGALPHGPITRIQGVGALVLELLAETPDRAASPAELADPPGTFRTRHRVPGGGPRTLLGLEGEVLLQSDLGRHVLTAGKALFVPAAAGQLHAGGSGRFVQASVP